MTEKTVAIGTKTAIGVEEQSDRRWVWGWSLFALLLASLPFIWGYLITPPGAQFMGLDFNALDANSYLAKMQEGARDNWRFYLVYTSEEHQGEFTFLFYILLGKVQALSGLPGIAVYHLARVLCGLFMLLVGYRFICRYFAERAPRRTAFLLLCFSAGLGWLVAPLGLTDSTDLWVAESLTFFSLLVTPHYPLATALLLLTVIWTQDGWEGQGWPAYGKAAASAFILGFVHPFMIAILGGVLGGFLLRVAIQQRRINWTAWFGTALVGVPGVLGPAYTYLAFNSNPLMRAWQSQNQTLSPPPWAYITGYGLLLVAALPGLWWAETKSEVRSQKSEEISSSLIPHPSFLRWQFVSTWFVINALLLYLPVSLQRRLVEGLHVPVVILATAGLYYAWKLKPRWIGRYVLATTLSILLLLATQVSNLYARPDPNSVHPLYLYNEEVGAMSWLKANTNWRDTVIASPLLGNYIPAHAGNRVYYGHDLETVNRAEKAPLLGRFLRGEMSKTEQQEFIQKNGLRYFYYGPEEVSLGEGKFDPAAQGWAIVYANDKVRIFKIA